jgi:hypothetical protein
MSGKVASRSWIAILLFTSLSVLAGCNAQAQQVARQPSSQPASAAASTEERKWGGLYLLQRYIALERDIWEAYESEPMQVRGLDNKLRGIEMELDFISYAFRGDIESRDQWRRWLEDHDSNIVREILDDPGRENLADSSRAMLAVDIAFEGGRKEDIEYVLRKYESMKNSHEPYGTDGLRSLEFAIGEWDANYHDTAEYGPWTPRYAPLSGAVYERLAEVMHRHKKDLEEVEDLLRKQESEEFGTRWQAALYSDLVVVAVADSVAVGRMDCYGVADCPIRASVSKVLKGAVGVKKIAFNAHIQEGESQEDPEQGKSYIFFLDRAEDGSCSFQKMLNATDANLKEVVKLVEEAAATRRAAGWDTDS